MRVRLNRVYKTTRRVAGHPLDLLQGQWVTVLEKSGKRYRVETMNGGSYWLDPDDLEPLGGGAS